MVLRVIYRNPLDKLLKKVAAEGGRRFLVVWNRGLGDIPLGLFALVHRIRSYVPHASITFMTRQDLAQAFSLLEGVQVIVDPSWERGKRVDIGQALHAHSLAANMFDVVLERPDPTRWLKWQIGSLVPTLKWETEWDRLVDRYALDPTHTYIGCHVQTETGQYYGYEKNWPLASWRDLFKKIQEHKKGTILLFGQRETPPFLMESLIDLRGKTTLLELLALIKNRCRYLVVPDSGVLSMAYYVNAPYPVRVVSLWADPKQGVLRQRVDSPNPHLCHRPLLGKHGCMANLSVEAVYHALFA